MTTCYVVIFYIPEAEAATLRQFWVIFMTDGKLNFLWFQ